MNASVTPQLTSLNLSASELQAVARQGSVVREVRGHRIYFRLRYRFDGRHRSRHLGSSPERAAMVQRELEELRSGQICELRLRELARRGRRLLRTMKTVLQPSLAQNGLHFHGLSLRKPRQAAAFGRTQSYPTPPPLFTLTQAFLSFTSPPFHPLHRSQPMSVSAPFSVLPRGFDVYREAFDRHLANARVSTVPIHGAIAVINNQLMELTAEYFATLQTWMRKAGDNAIEMAQLGPCFVTYQKFLAQITRFTSLEVRCVKEANAAEKAWSSDANVTNSSAALESTTRCSVAGAPTPAHTKFEESVPHIVPAASLEPEPIEVHPFRNEHFECDPGNVDPFRRRAPFNPDAITATSIVPEAMKTRRELRKQRRKDRIKAAKR